MKQIKTILAITLAGLLSACGSGGADDKATFSLGVSDNPFDAQIVQIAFKQVVLKNSDGAISFDVGQKKVDLLTVQGQEVETLVSGQDIPLGEYQMCIYMENSEVLDTTSSYVHTETSAGDAGLVTNSNGSCGGVGADEENTGRLFFNKTFTIAAGDNQFVAEFDLGKGLQAPHGNKEYWTLKPTAVQLINRADVGAIAGGISDQFAIDCETDAVDVAGVDNFGHAIYLYPALTELGNMADFRDTAYIDLEVAPIASARVNPIYDATDPELIVGHQYEFGFVVAGDYSLGYSCTAQNDSADLAEGVDQGFVMYNAQQGVTVTAEATTQRDF
ncbi:MAG: hypothetical protein ACJAT7_002011 [Psychromonas sp.]|jgi:hypothetical protein|uniref:DUF4382 domain-containing protein n=1 Tax=Psychromonas sp. TaxID=1884585 RepID=UPI0039E25F3F